jgi:uncharacterized protein (DUF433 family)
MSTQHYASTLAADIIARALARTGREPDIAPSGEIETVPECKILVRDGKPTEEAIRERRRFTLSWSFGPGSEPGKKSAPIQPIECIGHVPRRARAQVPVDMETVIRMRQQGASIKIIAKAVQRAEMTVWTRLKEYEREHGRTLQTQPKGRNRRITIERIYELQDQGCTNRQIARDLGVAEDSIAHAILAHRQSSDEAEAEYRKRTTCKCGGGKLARFKVCGACKQSSGAVVK